MKVSLSPLNTTSSLRTQSPDGTVVGSVVTLLPLQEPQIREFLSKSHRSQNELLDSEILQVFPTPQPEINASTLAMYILTKQLK